MAFGSTAKTSTPKSLGNIDKDDLNSNQEAVPVPYAAGRNRVPVTWITPCYNRKAKKVNSSGSSKAGDAGATYKYQVDLVSVISMCGRTPLVAISKIIVNHDEVWVGNITRRPGYPYESITVKKFGEMRIYWGQTDQPKMDWFTCHFDATKADDSFSAQPARTDDLPPYRGVSLLVMKGFQLGSSTQMPVVEVVVDRAPLWIAGEAAPVVDARGSNVIALLYEWLVDDWFGVGLDPAALNTPKWLAAYAAAEAAGHHVSPLITDQRGLRQAVAELLEYYDGWVRRDGALLTPGFWLHGDTDTSALPRLNDSAMIGEPELAPSGYGDTINQINVAFRDSSRYFHGSSYPANAPGNLRIVGERRAESVARPWIITAEHAAAYAAEYLNLKSQPSYTGPVKAKREWLAQQGVGPGSLVKLDSGTAGLEIVCRVTKGGNAADRDGYVALTLDSERGLYPSLYVPDPPPRVPDFVVVAAAIEHVRVLMLPSGLKTGSGVQLTVLAERPDPTLTGFRTYLSRDNASYDLLVPDATFAARGVLAQVYPADTAALDTVGLTLSLDGVDVDLVVAQSDAARDDNTLLCFVDGEIMSVGEVTALGDGRYRLALRRGVYGTAQAAHFQNAEVWLHRRVDLPILEATGTIEKGNTVYLKLPTHNATDDQALADATVVPYTVGLQSAVGAAFGLNLSTYAQAGTDGSIESHVQATWLNYSDQGIDLHEVAIKRANLGDAAWEYRTLSKPVANWTVTPSTPYQVMLRPINSLGEPGPWSAVQTITSASTSPFKITHLELTGQAHDLVNEEPDFHFRWELESPSRAGAVGGTTGQPLVAGLQDPAFADFVVQVLDQATGRDGWDDSTGAASYDFTLAKNAKGFGTPDPNIIFRVAARDIFGGLSDWAQIVVSNPPPPTPEGLNGVGSYKGGQLNWKFVRVPDLVGGQVAIGTTQNIATATVYDVGMAESKTFAGLSAGIVYAWVRAYDSFGSFSEWSAPYLLYVGTVPAADIVGLSTKLSTQYPNTVLLEGVVWGNHDPDAGSISWTCPDGPCISWQGKQYKILSNSTDQEFVWWVAGEPQFRVSDTNPETDPGVAWDPLTCFQIARNYLHTGVAQQVWVYVANMTVGAFYALDAAIKHGVFGQLIADEVDVIGTLQLQDQAVTIPVAAKTADFAWGGDWATAHSLYVPNCSGAPADILVAWGHSSPNVAATDCDYRIIRSTDGLVLEDSDFSVQVGNTQRQAIPSFDPQTLVGPATYILQLRNTNHTRSAVYPATARGPFMRYLETKK